MSEYAFVVLVAELIFYLWAVRVAVGDLCAQLLV